MLYDAASFAATFAAAVAADISMLSRRCHYFRCQMAMMPPLPLLLPLFALIFRCCRYDILRALLRICRRCRPTLITRRRAWRAVAALRSAYAHARYYADASCCYAPPYILMPPCALTLHAIFSRADSCSAVDAAATLCHMLRCCLLDAARADSAAYDAFSAPLMLMLLYAYASAA